MPSRHAPDDRLAAPRPAATVVLVRPGSRGPEVLLVRRPPSMAFAPDVHVFPGGALDPDDVSPRTAALRELAEEVGVVLPGADALVPLSRWVTPPGYPRRFDTRFYAAELPPGTQVNPAAAEVAAALWIRPADALSGLARGELPMWPPTATTLQQLEHVGSIDEIRARLAVDGLEEAATVPSPGTERVADDVVRIELPAAGAVPGQTANAYVVGRRELVVVDPGDPSEAALDAIMAAAAGGGGRVRAICLTHVDPDHAAGSEALAQRTGTRVYVGPGGSGPLAAAVTELADGERVTACDVRLAVHEAPGPRPDHVAYELVGRATVVSGDLVGARASRAVFGPPDEDAWRASLERLASLRPALLLPGHGSPLAGEVSRAAGRPTGFAGD